jgi:hypothetical protein
LQRDHDLFLMDVAISSTLLSDKEIRYINYCRLYLQVLHASDICTACGTRLAIGIYAGFQSNKQGVSKFDEPYQERPGPLAWQAWRKFLRIFSDRKGLLHRPLGNWLFHSTQLHRRWMFLYSPSLNLLFKWRLDTYVILRPVRSRIFSFGFKFKTMDLPDDSVPVDGDCSGYGSPPEHCSHPRGHASTCYLQNQNSTRGIPGELLSLLWKPGFWSRPR